MRLTSLMVVAATGFALLPAIPAEAQTRNRASVEREAYPGESRSSIQRRERVARQTRGTRITVRRPRTYLDPGTEVLPYSQPYTDYALPPLYHPTRMWDTTNSTRGPLPDNNFNLPGWLTP